MGWGGGPAKDSGISYLEMRPARLRFSLASQIYEFNPIQLFVVSLLVGLVGGAYCIGGGAILAPYYISVLALPVHAVAGASLFGTFMSSIVGIVVYSLGIGAKAMNTALAFILGSFFGARGLAGGYLGAMTQRHVPERPIKIGLLVVVLFASMKYLFSIFIHFMGFFT